MLYLFFFRTVINKVEKKKWTDILIETFAPLFAIIIIGIYAGIIFILTSELTGLFGLLMEEFACGCGSSLPDYARTYLLYH
jgi:hypothetical protein